MQVIARRTLRQFWERHPQAEGPLRAWFAQVAKANWQGPPDVKLQFGLKVDFVADNRVIFDLGGNKYRLVAHIAYAHQRLMIKIHRHARRVRSHRPGDGGMAKKVIRLLRSEADYDAALDEIEGYFDRPPEPGTPEADRFDLLALVIEDYERKHWPVDPPGPIDAIRFQMDVRGYSQADLGRVLGSRRRASEILSGRRPLTMQMAWTLHREWGIPAETLIQPQAPVRPRGRNASSVIQDFSYDARRQKLKIVFQTGRVYVYERVPAEVHAGLKNAPSQGAYFNNSIRDHFPCREIMPAG